VAVYFLYKNYTTPINKNEDKALGSSGPQNPNQAGDTTTPKTETPQGSGNKDTQKPNPTAPPAGNNQDGSPGNKDTQKPNKDEDTTAPPGGNNQDGSPGNKDAQKPNPPTGNNPGSGSGGNSGVSGVVTTTTKDTTTTSPSGQ